MRADNRGYMPAKKPFSPYAIAAVVAILAIIGIVFLIQQNNAPAAAPPASQPPAIGNETAAPASNLTPPAPKVPNATPRLPSVPANATDSHGCKIGAGFAWCGLKSKCLRPVEENCTTISGADALKYCGEYESVLICGEYIRASSSTAGGFAFYKNGGTAPIICPRAAKESMSDECRRLIYETTCLVPPVC